MAVNLVYNTYQMGRIALALSLLYALTLLLAVAAINNQQKGSQYLFIY